MKKIILGGAFIALAAGGVFLYKASSKSQTTTPVTVYDTKKNTTTSSLPKTEQIQFDYAIINDMNLVGLAQSKWSQEIGTYASSLLKIDNDAGSVHELKAIANAIKTKTMYKGYTLTELLPEDDTEGTRSHYSLLATPSENKQKSYLLILDLNRQQVFSDKKQDLVTSKEMQLFTKDGIVNLSKWPNITELEKWAPIKPREDQIKKDNEQP